MTRRSPGEGSIYQRADGKWVGMLDLTRPGMPRRRKAIYGHTFKEVQREMGKLRREYERHGDLPTAALTVEAWMTTWLRDIATDRVRPSTLTSHESKVRNYIVPALGKHRLDRLSPDHIRGMYRTMTAKGLSAATQRQTHAILSRALTVAMREGKVTRNAAQLMDPPSVRVTEFEPLNATEITAVLHHIAGHRLESRWLAALTLGLRQGEALGLGWDHVDLDDGTLTVARALQRQKGRLVMVDPKSERSKRTIPLPDFMLDSLWRRRDVYMLEREADGYEDHGLVWGQHNGRPVDPRADWQAWRDMLAAADVRAVRLHDARHSAATTLVALGIPLPVVMAILGHSQITMTARYSHADLALMRSAMELVNAQHRRQIEG